MNRAEVAEKAAEEIESRMSPGMAQHLKLLAQVCTQPYPAELLRYYAFNPENEQFRENALAVCHCEQAVASTYMNNGGEVELEMPPQTPYVDSQWPYH